MGAKGMVFEHGCTNGQHLLAMVSVTVVYAREQNSLLLLRMDNNYMVRTCCVIDN